MLIRNCFSGDIISQSPCLFKTPFFDEIKNTYSKLKLEEKLEINIFAKKSINFLFYRNKISWGTVSPEK